MFIEKRCPYCLDRHKTFDRGRGRQRRWDSPWMLPESFIVLTKMAGLNIPLKNKLPVSFNKLFEALGKVSCYTVISSVTAYQLPGRVYRRDCCIDGTVPCLEWQTDILASVLNNWRKRRRLVNFDQCWWSYLSWDTWSGLSTIPVNTQTTCLWTPWGGHSLMTWSPILTTLLFIWSDIVLIVNLIHNLLTPEVSFHFNISAWAIAFLFCFCQ